MSDTHNQDMVTDYEFVPAQNPLPCLLVASDGPPTCDSVRKSWIYSRSTIPESCSLLLSCPARTRARTQLPGTPEILAQFYDRSLLPCGAELGVEHYRGAPD